MIRLLFQKPLTNAEAVAKLSKTTNISFLTTQILAMSELEEKNDGQILNIMA
ncbi:MAG: hypothetical protein MJ229_07890 [bacterium]|nr:hypothetical protein [bacterium]